MTVRILTGDCRDVLRTLGDESVHCIVTSPPYFGLRDYGTANWDGGDPACDHLGPPMRTNNKPTNGSATFHGGASRANEPMGMLCTKCGARRIDSQIGLEPTPDAYVAELVGVFRECRRVLRKDGTLFLNLGDSYAGHNATGFRPGNEVKNGGVSNKNGVGTIAGLKPKDLIGIPWSVAFALRADGWYLRSDIIWAKPNPMPESVTDRPTKAHEYLFLLSKSERYFYDADAVRVPYSEDSISRYDTPKQSTAPTGRQPGGDIERRLREEGLQKPNPAGRNIRSVWTIPTQPFSEAHFATFPPDLIEPCIKAGTSEKGCCAKCGAPWKRLVEKGEADLAHQRACGGDAAGEYNGTATKDYASAGAQNASDVKARILAGMREKITTGWSPSCSCNAAVVPCTVLDPFGGAGTTALVADRLQRSSIIIELNSEYAAMSRRRVEKDAGMFAETEAA